MVTSPLMEENKKIVNVKDASCSIVMGIHTKEWDDLPSPGLMFCQTLSQEVLHKNPSTDKIKEAFSHNNGNTSIIHVVDTILADAEESRIGKNWYLINNQSTCNAFINGKYLSKIRNAPNGKYLRVQCNSGVTYTNRIGDLPGYSNPVYFNPKGVSKIISLGLVNKHHLVTYNS